MNEAKNEPKGTGMERIKAAAQTLTELRHTGRFIARLPDHCRPQSTDDALKIHERTIKIMGEVGGYKCSVPRGERTAVVAPIFAATISSAGPYAVLPASPESVDTARIEPEIAFVIGHDLPPRDTPYTEREIRAAIKETRLVLEILASRYNDSKAVPFVEQLADCISNQGLFIGPVVTHDIDATLNEIPLTIERTDTTPAQTVKTHHGHHPDGHPLLPLFWLANFQAARGMGLRAGQIVTTGSYAGAVDVPLNAPLRVVFGELGEISVEFRARQQ